MHPVPTRNGHKGYIMTYEDAQELMWTMEQESPTEREEREAVISGAWVETDKDAVDRADEVAQDIAERMAQDATLQSYRTNWYY